MSILCGEVDGLPSQRKVDERATPTLLVSAAMCSGEVRGRFAIGGFELDRPLCMF